MGYEVSACVLPKIYMNSETHDSCCNNLHGKLLGRNLIDAYWYRKLVVRKTNKHRYWYAKLAGDCINSTGGKKKERKKKSRRHGQKTDLWHTSFSVMYTRIAWLYSFGITIKLTGVTNKQARGKKEVWNCSERSSAWLGYKVFNSVLYSWIISAISKKSQN